MIFAKCIEKLQWALKSNEPKFTVEQVIQHSTPDDCWVMAHGRVYDATPFLHIHPGGPCIAKRAGTDATRDYEFHTHHGKLLWKRFCIGRVCSKKQSSPCCATHKGVGLDCSPLLEMRR